MALITKEQIKWRIFNNAKKHWGTRDADMESFDPVIGLLIEAFAFEISGVAHEIQSSRSRLIQKLAHLLTPHVHTAVQPARSILYARPTETQPSLSDYTQFYAAKPVQSGTKEAPTDVYWSAIGGLGGVNARIRYIATPSTLYDVYEDLYREPLYGSVGPKTNSIWIAIDAIEPESLRQPLRLFIDWRGLPDQAMHSQMLSSVKARTQFGPLKCSLLSDRDLDLTQDESFTSIDAASLFIDDFREKNLIIRQPPNSPDQFKPTGLPQELKRSFAEAHSLGRLEEAVWICLDFPASLTAPMLDECSILLNCFPIINRRFSTMRYTLREQLNIIPLALSGNEVFLRIDKITNHDGDAYLPIANSTDITDGRYVIRDQTVQRFDDRNARELLEHIINITYEESAAFSALGREYVSGLVKDVNQGLAALQQRLKNTAPAAANAAYLFVRPKRPNDSIVIEYWTTNGEAANGFRPQQPLSLHSGAAFYPNEIRLISPSSGGRGSLTDEEMIEAYRYALITRGQIISLNDVKIAARHHFHGKIESLEVGRGVMIGSLPEQGLLPVTDILITPNAQLISAEEWTQLGHDFLQKINLQSLPEARYRLTIKTPDSTITLT